ncbi:hypothetical protein ADUPG1_010778, partial [Aduncisulcus paluster]
MPEKEDYFDSSEYVCKISDISSSSVSYGSTSPKSSASSPMHHCMESLIDSRKGKDLRASINRKKLALADPRETKTLL